MTPEEIGLNARLIIAGAAGGVVNSLVFWTTWQAAVVTMVIGILVANYLGPIISKLLELPEAPSGFICGMAALVITNGTIGALENWFQKRGTPP